MFQPFLLVFSLSACLGLRPTEVPMSFSLAGPQAPTASAPQQNKEPELLTQGREAYRKGEFENALSSLQQVVETAPTAEFRARALYLLGRSYYSLDRYAEATTCYNTLLAENPAFALARYELGKVCLAQKDFGCAADHYAKLKQTGQLLQAEMQRRAETVALDPTAPTRLGADATRLSTLAKTAQGHADELAIYLADLFPLEEATRYQITASPAYPGAPTAETPILRFPTQMGKEGVGRPMILSREKARYTEPARLNLIQGTVVLSVVFSAEGELQDIRVIRGLPDGLTRKAIEAARKIRFNPATKDGVPVSVRGNVEFSFNLY